MLFKRKRKPERIVPGLERTKDNREFFIPQINVIEDKRTTRKKFGFLTPPCVTGNKAPAQP